MSLNKLQWMEMWESIKHIEKLNEDIRHQDMNDCKYQARCTRIKIEVNEVKRLIQSITGQLE